MRVEGRDGEEEMPMHSCYVCGREVRWRGDACGDCRQYAGEPWAKALRLAQMRFEDQDALNQRLLQMVITHGGWPEEEANPLDGQVLEMVRSGKSTKEIVAELRGTRSKGTSAATLYRKVRRARQVLDRWDTGSRQ
jgi:hypothetical protein